MANFKSNTGEFLSGFSNQPLSTNAFLRVEYPPTTMKIFTSGASLYFFLKTFQSVIVG